MGLQNGTIPVHGNLATSTKITDLTYDSTIPLLGLYPSFTPTHTQTHINTVKVGQGSIVCSHKRLEMVKEYISRE